LLCSAFASGGWNGLYLEFPKLNVSIGDWSVCRTVISLDKFDWAIFSFQPYKSPDIHGVVIVMLQQGFELLAGTSLVLIRASMALGYTPVSWRHIRVVFIPISKPGKPLSQVKSLRHISLMSFILKTFEKLLDGVIEKPLHQNQYAYSAAATAILQVV
jgi:hypothetical protein